MKKSNPLKKKMKKTNHYQKKNSKMETPSVPKVYKKPKNSAVTAVSEWVLDTLASSLSENQIKELREAFESKQGDLHKIISANIKDSSGGKKVKDPDAPKRGKSSYIFFCVENREKIKNSYPDMSAKDIIKELGRLWRDTSKDKKEKYIKMSNNDKERYSGEISEYVPSENFLSQDKKKKVKSGPKRGLTSYIFFCKEHRVLLKDSQPNLSTKEITSELGKLWKSFTDEKKIPYTKLAEEDKVRYNSEKTGWIEPQDSKEKKSDKVKEVKVKEPKVKETKVKEPKVKETKVKEPKEKKSKSKVNKSGGYILFCQEERDALKEDHPKWTSQQLTKELGKSWSELSEEEQNEYNEKADGEMIDDEEE